MNIMGTLRNPYFLGGIQGTISHQMLLSCPWNGTASLYYIKGFGILAEGRHIWRLPKDTIIIVRAGQTPVLTAAESPLHMVNIIVGGYDLDENSTSVFSLRQSDDKSTLELFVNLLEQLPSKREHIILSDLFTKLQTAIQLLMPDGIYPPESIRFLKKIFDTRYNEKLTLDKLARELHWNKYKLEKDFKRYYNYSPFEYLLNVRIKVACRLLCETSYSVLNIGLAVGIENTSYFIRIFKRQIGTSPQEYRLHHTDKVPLQQISPVLCNNL